MPGQIKNNLLSSDNIASVGEDLLNSAVGGLSPLNNFGRYLTGSRAIIKVNGKLFGFAFGVTFNIKTMNQEINTIDDWIPHELAPQRILVDGTLSMFHIPGKTPTAEMVQANVLSFLFHQYITIDITDQTTNQTIFRTERAVITSRSQSVKAGELSTMTLEWKALGWVDDIKPFWPTGFDSDREGGESVAGLTDISTSFIG
jgi:hypothetical protein